MLDAWGRGDRRYGCEVAAASAGTVETSSGLHIVAPHAFADVIGGAAAGTATAGPIDTLLVVGGDGVYAAAEDDELVGLLARATGHSRRMGSVCSGTFLLAAAGLLEGRRVTTHWARAGRLQRRHPAVLVDADPIHLRDGNIWTSAGVTAGIDLALALVEDDVGADVAQHVARHLVMFLRRPGGQSQFAAPLWSATAEREPIRLALDLIHRQPETDLSVPALARRVAMSERNFTRQFSREVGRPPARYVEEARVQAARRLLEQTTTPVDQVAVSSGFGTAETMRRAFLRRLGVPPADYRRRFRLPAASDDSFDQTFDDNPFDPMEVAT